MGRHRLDLWVRKFSWRRKWQPTPVFLPGKSHGQGRLTSYKESDVTVHNTQHSGKKENIERFSSLVSLREVV